jgi:hypothetical protein
VGQFLSFVFGSFRLLMPFLFNGDLAHGSLPDFLKAGCWAKFARTKLSKGRSEAFEPQKAIGQKHQDGVISDDKETASALEPD